MAKKRFSVYLGFDGLHEIIVEAKDEEEARELVMSGEFDDSEVKDKSEGYNVVEVEAL